MKTHSPRAKKTNADGASVSSREVFIVRLWREARDQPVWLGQVQHVRTGRIVHVYSPQELIAYLQSQMEERGEMPAQRGLR